MPGYFFIRPLIGLNTTALRVNCTGRAEDAKTWHNEADLEFGFEAIRDGSLRVFVFQDKSVKIEKEILQAHNLIYQIYIMTHVHRDCFSSSFSARSWLILFCSALHLSLLGLLGVIGCCYMFDLYIYLPYFGEFFSWLLLEGDIIWLMNGYLGGLGSYSRWGWLRWCCECLVSCVSMRCLI